MEIDAQQVTEWHRTTASSLGGPDSDQCNCRQRLEDESGSGLRVLSASVWFLRCVCGVDESTQPPKESESFHEAKATLARGGISCPALNGLDAEMSWVIRHARWVRPPGEGLAPNIATPSKRRVDEPMGSRGGTIECGACPADSAHGRCVHEPTAALSFSSLPPSPSASLCKGRAWRPSPCKTRDAHMRVRGIHWLRVLVVASAFAEFEKEAGLSGDGGRPKRWPRNGQEGDGGLWLGGKQGCAQIRPPPAPSTAPAHPPSTSLHRSAPS